MELGKKNNSIIWAVLFGVLGMLMNGIAFMLLWEWLIVGVFPVRSLGFVEALGVMFFLHSFLRVSVETKKGLNDVELVEKFLNFSFRWALTIGTGYLISLM